MRQAEVRARMEMLRMRFLMSMLLHDGTSVEYLSPAHYY